MAPIHALLYTHTHTLHCTECCKEGALSMEGTHTIWTRGTILLFRLILKWSQNAVCVFKKRRKKMGEIRDAIDKNVGWCRHWRVAGISMNTELVVTGWLLCHAFLVPPSPFQRRSQHGAKAWKTSHDFNTSPRLTFRWKLLTTRPLRRVVHFLHWRPTLEIFFTRHASSIWIKKKNWTEGQC